MNSLRNLQHNFLNYLLDDADSSIIQHIVSTPGYPAEQRMKFYGNAYRLRLQEALSSDYERLHSYLGDDLFAELMRNYIDQYPSRNPNLRYFGEKMVELISARDPFTQWPEVAELARIELAFNRSFDAQDTKAVRLQQLEQLDTDAWTTFTLKFHDSVQLLPQQFNSFQIWQALANDQTPPQKIADKSTWLVWRQDLVSRFRSVTDEEQVALKTALAGENFADICEALSALFSEEETPQRAVGYLQQWLNDEMICKINY